MKNTIPHSNLRQKLLTRFYVGNISVASNCHLKNRIPLLERVLFFIRRCIDSNAKSSYWRTANFHFLTDGVKTFLTIGILAVLTFQSSGVTSQVPLITTRFVNPSYECNGQYCLDVEFLADVPGTEIFGVNVRFFYPNSILSLIGFSDFQGGYEPIQPNPPIIITSAMAGPAFFNFDGPADFINGAIQLVDTNNRILLDNVVWTKLFQVCFEVVDPDPNEESFCPPVVWDLEQDPDNGGFLNGDDGVVITIVDPDPFIGSAPADVNVIQFNWTYTGSGGPPFGEPVENNCILLAPDASINGSTSNLCYYTNRIFQPVHPLIPDVTYQWTFGDSAVPLTAIGYGPHAVQYTSIGTKTVKLVISPNDPGGRCPDSSSISFNVVECLANISGNVKSVNNVGIGSVPIKLYADANLDGLPDTSIVIKSGNTLSNGNYNLLSIDPGNYVIVQSQPLGWLSHNDIDISPDSDLVPNIDSLDNIIPCTLTPSKLDIGNNFIERPAPGSISGYVFIDYNINNAPGPFEGLLGDTVRIYHDNNKDGLPDNGIPIDTLITNAEGYFALSSIPPGNYVIKATLMKGYALVEDKDATNDLDSVPNSNMHDNILPVTITNGENDDQNYFVDIEEDKILVKNNFDAGPGSLRQCVENAIQGDTIAFDSSLAGSTITITSTRILINKSISVVSKLTPSLTVSSQIPGLFRIGNSFFVVVKKLEVISGLSIGGNLGAAFENLGNLEINEVHIFPNPALPPGQYLIRNAQNSHLTVIGNCFINSE